MGGSRRRKTAKLGKRAEATPRSVAIVLCVQFASEAEPYNHTRANAPYETIIGRTMVDCCVSILGILQTKGQKLVNQLLPHLLHPETAFYRGITRGKSTTARSIVSAFDPMLPRGSWTSGKLVEFHLTVLAHKHLRATEDVVNKWAGDFKAAPPPPPPTAPAPRPEAHPASPGPTELAEEQPDEQEIMVHLKVFGNDGNCFATFARHMPVGVLKGSAMVNLIHLACYTESEQRIDECWPHILRRLDKGDVNFCCRLTEGTTQVCSFASADSPVLEPGGETTTRIDVLARVGGTCWPSKSADASKETARVKMNAAFMRFEAATGIQDAMSVYTEDWMTRRVPPGTAALTRLARATEDDVAINIEERAQMRTTFGCCGLCGLENAGYRCGACGEISYCGRDCQRAHWGSGHKAHCSRAREIRLKLAR